MNKVFAILFLIVFVLPSAVDAQTQEAVSYLKSLPASPWQVMALGVAGEEEDAVFLRKTSGNSAVALEAPLLALVAAGKDPRSFPYDDLVSRLKTYADGVQLGESSLLNDDIYGILALRGAGLAVTDPIVQASRAFLVSHQASDGGWSWQVGGSSETDMTAAAIMALLESGMSATEDSVQRGVAFLEASQNEDGGFPSMPGSPYGTASNSASDALVLMALNALKEDSATWTKGGRNVRDHLLSLQALQGFFGFESANEDADAFAADRTAQATIALLGKSLPTQHLIPTLLPSVSFRIEGSQNTVCAGTVAAANALQVVSRAAAQCGYSYELKEFSFGPYVRAIASDTETGDKGWRYRVNWQLPSVGAVDFALSEGDLALWYFLSEDQGALRVRLSQEDATYLTGQELAGTVEAYTSSWAGMEGATVSLNGATVTTDAKGAFSFFLTTPGLYELRALKEGFVRSPLQEIVVGDTLQQVELSVTLVPPSEPTQSGSSSRLPEAAFSVSSPTVSFGSAQPGQVLSETVTLINQGQKDLTVRASVLGDEIFKFLKIAQTLWSQFQTSLPSGSQKSLNIQLSLPSVISSYGKKTGSLIFWGQPQ